MSIKSACMGAVAGQEAAPALRRQPRHSRPTALRVRTGVRAAPAMRPTRGGRHQSRSRNSDRKYRLLRLGRACQRFVEATGGEGRGQLRHELGGVRKPMPLFMKRK